MARSKYIYLIYRRGTLLSAHTVKYEAHRWLERSRWTPEQTTLKRMQDGFGRRPLPYGAKNLDTVEWEFD